MFFFSWLRMSEFGSLSRDRLTTAKSVKIVKSDPARYLELVKNLAKGGMKSLSR